VIGDVLWSPPDDLRETSELGRFMEWLASRRGLVFADYDELWRWSVDDLDGFWGAIVEFFEIRFHTGYERVLADRTMPGAEWCPGGRLNYAEHMLGLPDDAKG
jgi:acetoacetyl-CoA synthetase